VSLFSLLSWITMWTLPSRPGKMLVIFGASGMVKFLLLTSVPTYGVHIVNSNPSLRAYGLLAK
jgi:hypothetical protein